MSTGTTPSRVTSAVVAGVSTTVHFALPDFVPSRTARGWVKAGLTAVAVAASASDVRAAWAAIRQERVLDDEGQPAPGLGSLPAGSKAVVAGSVAAALAGSAGAVLLAERWAFRHGQARAAAGKRLPHTGPALLYGALAGALSLLPEPSDRS